MNNRTDPKRIAMFPLLLLMVTLILMAFGSGLFIELAPSITQIDEGWSIKYGDKVYENVTLSDFDFGNLKKDDLIILSNTIPEQQIYAPTIMFKSSVSTVDVRIDGKYAYTYGHIYDDMDKLVPKKIHLITLDDMASERSIEIMFKITESNVLRYMFPIYCGTKRELIRNFLQRQRLSIFLGGFFIMYACLLIALEVYLFLSKQKSGSMLFSAFISLVFGVYTYAYKDIFCIMSDRDYFFTLVEYISLYLIPLSISLLLYSTHPNIATIRQRLFLAINTIMPIAYFILHATNKIHLNRFVNQIQIIALVENAVIIPSLVLGIAKARKAKVQSETYTNVDADNYLLLGYVILIFFSIVEIIKFNIVKYKTYSDSIYSNINFLTVGSLYFIMCLFIYYFFHGIDHMNTQFLKVHLEGLAYTDALTGLMNRAKCMQYLASVKGSYALVSLDLDRLKSVNDQYGHNAGAKMIKAFADLLTKAFEKASIIGRTGGDEFLVAFEDPSSTICSESIQKLQGLMDEFNQNSAEKFTLSASAGYAYSYEDKDAIMDNVFYLADERMYKMKEEHHE